METQFTEAFKARIRRETDTALRTLRENAFAKFVEIGFPSLKAEDWKYTNVSAIAKEIWTIASEPPDFTSETDVKSGELIQRFNFARNGFAALNLALADFAVIRIPENAIPDKPIEISLSAGEGKLITPHILVIAGKGSKAVFIENYESFSKGFTNTAVQVVLEENAQLKHFRIQKESAEAFHCGVTEVSLARNCLYDATNINLGGAISRHDIDLKFKDEGSEAYVDGLYLLDGKQHTDTHSSIDHIVPNCISHQTYKGVLSESSRAVFNGKVFVRENAYGTDAQQSNKNLLLSDEARVDTKPQLEIFNDDVKCSHGATVGQLEDEELFYLSTRGLPDDLARNLLTYGFAEEIIKKISIENIRVELNNAVLRRLPTVVLGDVS